MEGEFLAVLTLYFLNVLKFSGNHSIVFFNVYNIFCYTTPILGSIVADGYIGKFRCRFLSKQQGPLIRTTFRTILAVSIVYALGQVLLAVAATGGPASFLHPWLDITALLVIALGTGGIKPCVASFGADQFAANQFKMLSIFFSTFYFAINAGSLLSTITTPFLRSLFWPFQL